jgi:hypothetical protein
MPITVEQLGAKLLEVAKVGPIASENAVKKGAALVREEVLASLTAVGVHGFTLRGVSRKKGGAKLGAVVKVSGSGNSTTAIIKATGPWQFIERDTARHQVGAKLNANEDYPVLHWGNVWATGPFMAGGSHGRHPWAIGEHHAQPKVKTIYEKEVFGAVRKAF